MSLAARLVIVSVIVAAIVVVAVFLGVQVGGCACPVPVSTIWEGA